MAFEFETSDIATTPAAAEAVDLVNGTGTDAAVATEDSPLAGTDQAAADAIEIPEDVISVELNRQLDEWDAKVWQAQEKYDQQIVDLRNQQVEAALEMSKAIEVAKHKRSVHKNVLEELEQALAEGPFVPTKPTWESVHAELVNAAKAERGEAVEVHITDDWESISTETVIKGVEGLGPSKLDKILSLYPTLGKLQAARIEASTDCKEFCDVLPKGCGRELASKIEIVVDEAIMKVTNN